MINPAIPLESIEAWQNLFSRFQRLIGCRFVLCQFEKNAERFLPIVTSDKSIDLNLLNEQWQPFCSRVMENGALTRELLSSDHLINDDGKEPTQQGPKKGIEVVGLPICWLSKKRFGCLVVLPKDEPLSDDDGLLLDSVVSHIEKDLIALYQKAQLTHQAELAAAGANFAAPDFQMFIDSFKDHLWVKDMNGVYTFCNKEVEAAWHSRISQIIGYTDGEIFDKELTEKFLITDKKVVEEGTQMVVEEYSNVSDPENKTWLETIKAPIVDNVGQTVGIIGMTRNVTNRKVIEDQLMIAGTVFENSVEGVIISDRNGNIAYVNKAFCEITGYSEVEAVGRNPRFLKSGRHDGDFYREMWNSLVMNGKWQGELWNRRKDGAIYPELSTISVVYDENNEICNFVGVFADISLIKKSEAELTHMAYHDPLTDLPNRLKLSTQIEQEIQHVERNSGQFATIFIDIDHFKHINDSYGHLIGDEVLCEIASRLKKNLRAEDTIARIGGDEFVVLLTGVSDPNAVALVVSKLMKIFDMPIVLSNGEQLRFTGSMGIALYPQDGADSGTLLRNADVAMYRAKHDGRNNFAFYTESLTKESEVHLKLQSAMHGALENDGFQLVYQPQFNMASGKLIGFESLIRWKHPTLGEVSPLAFIPVAEKAGLIHDIGRWVLETACRQGVEWLEQGYDFGRIAVNVAGQQLQKESFVEQVISVVNETGLPTHCLELEVTEGFMMSKPERSIKYLKALRRFGIELSMDDFGTGYSSLSYLQQLPLNKIKIDQSFVNDLPHDSNGIAITDAIIAMGNALSLKVIAEGVETKEQVDFLIQRGCLQGQGYYYSKPLAAEQLTELLETTRK
ncbi:EAL domain-containing protein [Vibrio sp. 99-8-1]|nr:EAL domain-containing protein [Vibrio sp. 99-8-1]